MGYPLTNNYLFENTWKYQFPWIDRYLASMVSVSILQRGCGVSNILSTLYLCSKGIREESSNFLVVAFRVILACAMLMGQRSLKTSGVFAE